MSRRPWGCARELIPLSHSTRCQHTTAHKLLLEQSSSTPVLAHFGENDENKEFVRNESDENEKFVENENKDNVFTTAVADDRSLHCLLTVYTWKKCTLSLERNYASLLEVSIFLLVHHHRD
ncbi:hypothetical protein ZIOFF_028160 [Zingiber officinale]|uniref:Uncharacterized protein n=1 Tax=Zingiber officinale TaxID=94328 RepID=A0A8J5GUK6_ZINOF|nr:hypothetical protein ZIOFF_028160 [Zingiber officinale]